MDERAKNLYYNILNTGTGSGGGQSLPSFNLTLDLFDGRSATRKFFFEEGWTWNDFVGSEYDAMVYLDDIYNLIEIFEGGTGVDPVVYMGGFGDAFGITYNGNAVMNTDEIIANATYNCVYHD